MSVRSLFSRQTFTSTVSPTLVSATIRGSRRISSTGRPANSMITSPARMPAAAAGPSSIDARDQRPLRLLQPQGVGDLLGDLLDPHADPAALHRAGLDQLLDDRPGDVAGDGEADADAAAGRREDRGVDADHLAVEVEHRPAGVAAVDRRVGLQEVVVGPGVDVAVAGGDDAGRHRAAEAERVADGDHPVADPQLVRSRRR